MSKHHSLNKRDYNELGKYLRALANEMGLRDWIIVLEYQPPAQEESLASCECIYGRKLAQIRVRDDFRMMPLETIRQTIVHELIHPHLDRADEVVTEDLVVDLSQQAHRLVCRTFRRELEFAVDALADVIAPHLPLIEWPEVGK